MSILTAKATVYDPHGTELSGERGTSTAFSGEGEKPSRRFTCTCLEEEWHYDCVKKADGNINDLGECDN